MDGSDVTVAPDHGPQVVCDRFGAYNGSNGASVKSIAASTVIPRSALGQTPQPFPRPGSPPQPAPPRRRSPRLQCPPMHRRRLTSDTPTRRPTLGVPLYPTGQFIAPSMRDEGSAITSSERRAPFAELVTYYRTVLKERGDEVFEQPPTHIFEVGRFREETMAFPPSVTIKDWTSGGSAGYPNPRPGAQPRAFRRSS